MKASNAIGRKVACALALATLLTGCSTATPEAMLASGKDYLAKNDRPAAVIQLKNALQKNPDLAEARYLLGKSLLETGEVQAAEKELRKASELNYLPDEVIPLLAQALLLSGEPKKVIAEFGKTEFTSANARAGLHTTLGQAHLALGNRDAASAAFSAALAAKAGHPDALLGQARLKARTREQLPEALAIVETALASAPRLTEAWQFKGDILAAQGHPDPALAAYRNAVDVKPDFLPAHSQMVVLYSQQGKTDEAARQLEAMKKVAPQHPNTLYLQALLAYQKKDFAAAREAIQQELRLTPDFVAALLLSAAIELELKSFSQAETNATKVLQQNPNNVFARRLLIFTYLRNGQPGRALEAIRPVLDRIDKDSDMLALAGEIFMQNGEVAEAANFFEKSAALDPKNSNKRTARAVSQLAAGGSDMALQELADIAASETGIRADLALIAATLRRREFDKALAAIDRVEKKQPDGPLAPNLRAVALFGKGDFAAARRNFEQALERDPAHFPAAVNLARLDLAEKKPDEAQKRFERVLAKDPKQSQALLALADLRAQRGASADEVTTLINNAIAASPGEVPPRLALITHHLRVKNAKKAVEAAQTALAAFPARPDILDALARAQQANGEIQQSLTTYANLSELQPNSPIPLLRTAEIQMAAKNDDAARQALRRALAMKPELVEAQRAMIALDVNAGRTRDALAVARQIQKQRPKQPVGYVFEGDIHALKKAWPDAEAAYRTAIKQGGRGDVAAKLHGVLILDKRGEADKFASTWQKEHATDSVFRFYLAEVARMKNDYPSALTQYRGLVDLQPNNPVFLNNLAWTAGQARDPRALEYAERANRLAPDSPDILDTLGTLLIEKGENQRGIDALQRASGLAPQSSVIRLNLAKSLLKAGQKDAAKKELEVLSKLGDKFPRHAEVAELAKGL